MLPLAYLAAFSGLGLAQALPAAQSVALPIASPSVVYTAVSTATTVSVVIQDATVIPSSVFLYECDPTGKPTTFLATLNDQGENVGAIAGDHTFSAQILISQTTPGIIRLVVSAAFRGVLRRTISDIIIVDVVAPPTTLGPPIDALQETRTGGNAPYVFTSERFTGTIVVPSQGSTPFSSLHIGAGIPSRSGPVTASGFFTLRMNQNSTALLHADDANGNHVLLGIFPKAPNLSNVNPVLSPLSTAVALLYTQPGVVVTDPALAAFLLKAIGALPETAALAAVIQSKLTSDPAFLSHPDSDLVSALNAALAALANLTLATLQDTPAARMAAGSAGTKGILASGVAPAADDSSSCTTTDTASFHEIYSQYGDDANVCIDASGFNVAAGSGTFATTNYSPRWVFHYIDPYTNGVQSATGPFVGASYPREFQIPGIAGLFVDFVGKGTVELIRDLFTSSPDAVLQEWLDQMKQTALSYVAPATSSFAASVPSSGSYLFTSYTILVSSAPDFSHRAVAPALLTAFTEIALPVVSLVSDTNSTLFPANNLDPVSTSQLIVDLSTSYSQDVQGIAQSFTQGDDVGAFKQLAAVLISLATDDAFLKWLAQNGPFGEHWANVALKDLQFFAGKLSPLGLVDLGIGGANIVVTGVVLFDTLKDFTAFDADELLVGPTGSVSVQATLDSSRWPGSVSYSLTCAGQSVSGTAVPNIFASEPVGQCSVSKISGGPANSTLTGVSPSMSQTLGANQALTFVLQFKSNPPVAGFMMSSGIRSATDGQTLNLTVASGSTATVTFDGTSRSSAANGANITAWQWTVDGSVVSTSSSFSKSLATGTHAVSLVVTDSRNAQSQPATGTVVVARSTTLNSFSWTQLPVTGGPSPRDYPSTVYDPGTNELILFGGLSRVGPCCISYNDVWVLSNANGLGGSPTWTLLAPTLSQGAPPPRAVHSAIYDPQSNRMVIFGGGAFNGSTFELFNDVWVLTNANGQGGIPTWIPLLPSGGSPAAREGHRAVYDAANNEMIMFGGGNNGIMSVPNDVWVLSDANGIGSNPRWTQLAPQGTIPSPRERFAVGYDPQSNHMTIFGGCCYWNNDTYVLTNANGLGGIPEWSFLSPSGTLPSIRETPNFAYDAAQNFLLIFGMAGPNVSYNDLWQLADANAVGTRLQWNNLIPDNVPGSPPIVRNFYTATASSYDSANHRLIIFRTAPDSSGLVKTQIWVVAPSS